MRQGYSLSPILFTLLIADLDNELEKRGWGGVKIKEGKVWALAYADDVAIIAEDETGMVGMLRNPERYVERKGLEVNAEKTKVMRCRRRGGRQKKVKWRWKGREIEVKKFKYLGYVVAANGDQKEQVRDRVRKMAAVMGQVWGIRKRKFGKEWGRRIWLFDRLVWGALSYGVEIWGWKEREEVERLHERYLRWLLGVKRFVPWYTVREELQREKMKGRAGLRVWGYERKLEEGRSGLLVRLFWKELKEKAKTGKSVGRWEREREEYFESLGWSTKEVEE